MEKRTNNMRISSLSLMWWLSWKRMRMERTVQMKGAWRSLSHRPHWIIHSSVSTQACSVLVLCHVLLLLSHLQGTKLNPLCGVHPVWDMLASRLKMVKRKLSGRICLFFLRYMRVFIYHLPCFRCITEDDLQESWYQINLYIVLWVIEYHKDVRHRKKWRQSDTVINTNWCDFTAFQ